MLNDVTVIGYICTEITFTGKEDKQYCRFRVAVPRDYKTEDDKRPADFVPCIAFGLTAERIYTDFVKGNKICLKGRLESSTYDKNGETKYGLALNVKKFYYEQPKPKTLEEYAAEFSQGE